MPLRPYRRTLGSRRIAHGLLAALGAVAVLASGHGSGSADQLSDQLGSDQQQRNHVSDQMQSLRTQLAATQNQEKVLRAAIDTLNAQVIEAGQAVHAAQDRLSATQQQLAITQDHLAQTQAQLAVDKQHLGNDLAVMYRVNDQSEAVTQLLTSSSFMEFWQRVIALQRVSEAERSAAERVHDEEAQIQTDLTVISAKQAEEKQLVAHLRSVLDQLNADLGARQEAEVMLAAVEASDAQRLADAEAAATQLDAEIARLQALQAAARRVGGGNGHFSWPLTGPITQPFGCTDFAFEVWDASCPGHHFHSGLDIAPPCGTAIAAADSGIASTVYGSTGYGNHVIIVHGGGWMSIYGHMAAFAVRDGQPVGRGQTIGYEGSSGNSTGCHLHFEIRLNGSPVNPLAYLP